MSKSKLQIPLIFSLLFLLATPISVKADDRVSITIRMSGDAYVTITNSNGSITFVYNGRNVLKEYKWTVSRVNSNKLAIMLLKRDLKRLIYALNETFADLYGKVYFLAHVTGAMSNSSRVTMQLRSGNMTLVDFIDQLLNATEKQDVQIRNIRLEIASNQQETRRKLSEVFNQISMNKAYFEDQLSKMDAKIDRINARLDVFEEETNSTFTKLFDNLELLKLSEEANARSMRIAIVCMGILNLIMLVLLVWIASWKTKTS